MNGHFEIQDSAYPIGYLKSGEGYRVTDMRNLTPLHSQPIPLASAVTVAADVNKRLRTGQITGMIETEAAVRFLTDNLEV